MLLWNHMRMRSKASSAYQALRSLRFRAANSAYLSRTPTVVGNQQKFTLSGWVKRGGALGTQQIIFSAGPTPGGVLFYIGSDNALHLSLYVTAAETLVTSQLLRDTSAHCHIQLSVDTTQATASNRVLLYINGALVTSFSNVNYPAQNTSLQVSNTVLHRMGVESFSASAFFDGYLSEVNFIDGQALAPTSFGKYDQYGNWQAIKYTGTYGTNGFYLDFSDPSSTTNLCLDRSGNGNHWTPNGISVTAGATYDSMLDVPLGGGGSERGNYATLNSTQSQGSGPITWFDGNLRAGLGNTTNGAVATATAAIQPGQKVYFETTVVSGYYVATGGVGVISTADAPNPAGANTQVGYTANGYGFVRSVATAYKNNNNSFTAYGTPLNDGDVVGVAMDNSAGTLRFYLNNTDLGIAFSNMPSVAYLPAISGANWSLTVNFGQRPFAYTPPTGFKALHTGNLPDPTVPNPKTGFSIAGWIGNASTKVIAGVLFQADILWGKCRSAVTNWSQHDSARGAVNRLNSNTTTAEVSDASVVASFNSDGFTLGGSAALNANASTNAGWMWKKGAVFGVDVVQTTLTSGNQTVPHTLGVVPELIIAKSRNTASNWAVWVSGFTKDEYVLLNTTDSKLTTTNAWGATTPTVSNFGLNGGAVFAVSDQIVAYLFSSVRGYSKVGVFLGNGSVDGPFVDCGFKPAFVLTKRVLPTGAADWFITDTTSNPYNVAQTYLAPNATVAEAVNSAHNMDILSNGFKLRTAQPDRNTSGGAFIYMAFADTPFKYALAR